MCKAAACTGCTPGAQRAGAVCDSGCSSARRQPTPRPPRRPRPAPVVAAGGRGREHGARPALDGAPSLLEQPQVVAVVAVEAGAAQRARIWPWDRPGARAHGAPRPPLAARLPDRQARCHRGETSDSPRTNPLCTGCARPGVAAGSGMPRRGTGVGRLAAPSASRARCAPRPPGAALPSAPPANGLSVSIVCQINQLCERLLDSVVTVSLAERQGFNSPSCLPPQ